MEDVGCATIGKGGGWGVAGEEFLASEVFNFVTFHSDSVSISIVKDVLVWFKTARCKKAVAGVNDL